MAEPAIDSEAAWLAGAEVAVVGLGLMGGSLAVALRGGPAGARRCRRVVGVVRRAGTIPAAAPWVDHATIDLGAVATADVVVLATPARTILRLLPEVAPHLRPGTLLTDLGSTKAAILDGMATLRADLLRVGGHPMCGKEAGGLAAADPHLYAGAPFVLCPLPGESAAAVARAAALARSVGAQPLVLDAATHDRLVAAISHTPYTTAVALVAAAEALAAGEGAAGATVWQLAAGGFRDSTRVAAGELEMWTDILLTNRAAVRAHLARLHTALAEIDVALEQEDAAALRAILQAAQERRRDLFRAPDPPKGAL